MAKHLLINRPVFCKIIGCCRTIIFLSCKKIKIRIFIISSWIELQNNL